MCILVLDHLGPQLCSHYYYFYLLLLIKCQFEIDILRVWTETTAKMYTNQEVDKKQEAGKETGETFKLHSGPGFKGGFVSLSCFRSPHSHKFRMWFDESLFTLTLHHYVFYCMWLIEWFMMSHSVLYMSEIQNAQGFPRHTRTCIVRHLCTNGFSSSSIFKRNTVAHIVMLYTSSRSVRQQRLSF